MISRGLSKVETPQGIFVEVSRDTRNYCYKHTPANFEDYEKLLSHIGILGLFHGIVVKPYDKNLLEKENPFLRGNNEKKVFLLPHTSRIRCQSNKAPNILFTALARAAQFIPTFWL
ncbi:unnamed protein product [Onchocerca ochengi]|nr:unnamed protein product [Onchocerca ochengi]